MQRLFKLLLLPVLLSLIPSGATAQKSVRKTRKASPPPIICSIASVPKGMVVVGYKRNSACSDGAELVVKRPENGDIICAESPVPPQFSIATEAQGNSVGTCPNKAFLISGGSRGSSGDTIGQAFASGTTNIQVEGKGTVIRVLSDDENAPRHQRFIVELASGQTLLVTHNIDIAPRISGLEEGDSVSFNGEYVWNAKGGVIHWTHHDPRGRHIPGWVIHNGKTYK
ncbi:MAG TPA: DUF3465 domain-containing protein [Pyrinomonadaceae bacterium]|nr:DUF3465 domain-containing protein [Pyrinomonadaceae bacterium]